MKQELVCDEELRKAKRQLEKLIYSQLETVEGQASKLGYYELLGDYRLAEAHQNAIKEVTPDQVAAVAGKYLEVENCSLVSYLPEDRGGQRPVKNQVERSMRECLQRTDKKEKSTAATHAELRNGRRPDYGDTTQAGASAGEEQITLARLDNGVRVLVKRRSMIPLVTMLTMFQAGARLEKSGESGLSLLTLRSILKGSRSYSAEEIAIAVEGFGGSIDSFSQFDTAGVYVNVLSKHLEDVLPIYGEVIHQALFEDRIIEKEKEKLLEEITERKDTPFQFGMDKLFENVFGDHPYSHPFLGREEDVKRLTSSRLKAWHESMIIPENIVICFVGDIAQEKAVELADKLYGHLARRTASELESEAPLVSVHPGLHEQSRSNLKQSVALVGFTAPPMMSKDAISLEVLNGILSGLGGRLFVELRDKRSLGYMTGSAFLPLKERSILFGYANPSVNGIDEAMEVIQHEFDLVTREKVTGEELTRAKAWLIGSLSIQHQRNYSKARVYSSYETLGFGYDVLDRMPAIIRSVTKEDILRAAAGIFDRNKAVLIKIIPE
jgi:zinc protease